MIADIVAQDVSDAGIVAGSRTHPEDIVVAPLDIQRMMMHEIIHDFIGMGTAVVNVADDVQMVDSQALDQAGQGIDELARATCFQDGIEDFRMIDVAILVFIGLSMEQFIDDIAEDLGHSLTDFRTRIFRRQQLGQPQHMIERRPGPFVVELALPFEQI